MEQTLEEFKQAVADAIEKLRIDIILELGVAVKDEFLESTGSDINDMVGQLVQDLELPEHQETTAEIIRKSYLQPDSN
jgi:hypothetical protein